MKPKGLLQLKTFNIMLLSSLLCTAVTISASARGEGVSSKKEDERSLQRFLQTLDGDHSARYIPVLRDLNGDRRMEAVVYMLGDNWCGNGGCDLLVLTRKGRTWEINSTITIARPPIMILTSMSHGWHALAVRVAGGGIYPGYEAQLNFNGKKYPQNPSIPPAVKLSKSSDRGVIISSTKGAMPLYDDNK